MKIRDLGMYVKVCRQAKGLSVRDVSGMIGVEVGPIKNFEAGRTESTPAWVDEYMALLDMYLTVEVRK